MDKQHELKRTKRLALLLLLLAAITFIVTLFLPPGFWVSGVKAIAEAAMVGALADWFAVVALFRRVPVPFISRHTAIIPRNKDRIGENLGRFVQEKFLDTDSLLNLIRRHDPSNLLAQWLNAPGNADRIGRHLLQVMRGFLDLTDDARIQTFMRRAVHRAIDKVDLSQTSALLLESLTKNNRHQALLDAAIEQLLKLLHKPSTREFIAMQLVRWLKREHPIKAKMLPTEWLGEHSAELVANAVDSLLDDVALDQGHELRLGFNRAVDKLIVKLQNDPEMAERAEEIKGWLKEDASFNRYIGELWNDMRNWLKADLSSDDSRVQEKVRGAALWLGETLAADPALRDSMNQHLEQAARSVAPEFAGFLTRHISDTVKSWDARDMSQQIELNIGKDLQFIRINGTLVGGTIGLILYLLSQLPQLLPLLSR
ncbi:DUF445 domain-containing protein [Pantoea agglomerans]|jgi:uncharacterized membrane-anchored protein YjiN (DUF445 family)|uniref:Uncharacterized membrane-anchored protein YjiN (DUF445 family) n=2 Tax=Enterobacter agglomerans TaxID=549 RepID=A0AAJ5SGB7_ENTAG|nr:MULTISPECIES: DUF445 domain-containing protein [Pantoea]KYN64169.1 hypothetical protein IU46_003045 [Pantoea agglomerans]MBB1228657.1 DUF445 domain-containing protein [Pantoea pleuroti]MBD8117659.1 DUF445 domain-containing protein [Pantoea agglomerans]MBD8181355.1 DUF445 domain-containing protein [Pantoea agglomerans]MBD8221771.1 DUF445 domain-containing protein [Pantoea agglomerans]